MKTGRRLNIWLIAVVAGGLVLTGLVCLIHYERTRPVEYASHLDDTLVTVDGWELTFADCALYVALEELTVEEQAQVYDYYDTQSYWNLHINGEFVKVAAKRAALEQAVHDAVFYRCAVEEGLELSHEEQQALACRQEDFWMDLTEEQREKLGVSREQLDESWRRAALAEKYQNQIAAENNSDFEGYSVGALPYERLLGEHEYEINERLWDRVPFGDVILEH